MSNEFWAELERATELRTRIVRSIFDRQTRRLADKELTQAELDTAWAVDGKTRGLYLDGFIDTIRAIREALPKAVEGVGKLSPGPQKGLKELAAAQIIPPVEVKRGTGQGAKMRQDVFSTPEGDVVLRWPTPLSAESIQDVKDWLKIAERKIMRSATEETQTEKAGD